MITKRVEDQNGAATWRALVNRYEPTTSARSQSITTETLPVKHFPTTLAEFEGSRGDWYRYARCCEAAPGPVSKVGVKNSIYLQKAPGYIRTAFRFAKRGVLRLVDLDDRHALARQRDLRRRARTPPVAAAAAPRPERDGGGCVNESARRRRGRSRRHRRPEHGIAKTAAEVSKEMGTATMEERRRATPKK